MSEKMCTCTWSRITPTSPSTGFGIEWYNPQCPFHGWRSVKMTKEDEAYEVDAENQERKMPW